MQLTESRATPGVSAPPFAPSSNLATDLFDSYWAWRREPVPAFEAWIRRRLLSDRSRGIYLSMWQRLVRWMADRHPEIGSWSLDSLDQFLNHETLPNRHRNRYRLLVERVFDHLAELGHTGTNPARALRALAHPPVADRATQFLTREQRAQLIAHCEHRSADLIADPGAGQAHWVEWRDLALIALTLGAGLKLQDLQRISVSCIDPQEGLVRPRPKANFRAPVQAFAVPILRQWIISHREQGFDVAILFPAVRRKGAFAPKQAGKLRLHEASMFRRIRNVISEAGIQGDVHSSPSADRLRETNTNGRIGRSTRICGQTLRNTYAAILFDAGMDDRDVMLRMGFQRHSSVQRLRAAWATFLTAPAGDALPAFGGRDVE